MDFLYNNFSVHSDKLFNINGGIVKTCSNYWLLDRVFLYLCTNTEYQEMATEFHLLL